MLRSVVFFASAALAMAGSTLSLGLAPRAASASDVVVAIATPQSENITATFRFIGDISGGKGLELAISASGLEVGVEYPYHIHTKPVPEDGNCTATEGHLDPYGIMSAAGDAYKCSPEDVAGTCELGDLAGIFGKLVGDAEGKCAGTFNAAELTFGGKNTILDHSIVIHGGDGARLACGNIIGYVLAGEPDDAQAAHVGGSEEKEAKDSHDDKDNHDDKHTTDNGSAPRAALSLALLVGVAAAALF
ncbi:Superoxide dismutase [Coemansia sp. RSA 552]|nr:Superoxide dismutase [Coemansia sp. RSA 552]